MPGMDFLAMLKRSGFLDVQIFSGSGFRSSPFTEGLLFTASKPMLSRHLPEENAMPGMDFHKEFMETAYLAGAIDRKTKYLIGLAASLAAGCDP